MRKILESIVVGILFGLLTHIAGKYLPEDWQFLVETKIIWLLPAFLMAFNLPIRRWAKDSVIVATITLLVTGATYYTSEVVKGMVTGILSTILAILSFLQSSPASSLVILHISGAPLRVISFATPASVFFPHSTPGRELKALSRLSIILASRQKSSLKSWVDSSSISSSPATTNSSQNPPLAISFSPRSSLSASNFSLI